MRVALITPVFCPICSLISVLSQAILEVQEADLAELRATLERDRIALEAETADVTTQRQAAEELARESKERLDGVETRSAALQEEGQRLVVRHRPSITDPV